MAARTTTGIVTPIATLAPLDSPLDSDIELGGRLEVDIGICELDIPALLDVEEVELVVWGGALKAARSLLCHQIGIASPQTENPVSVIVVVIGGALTRTLLDRVIET